MGAPAVAVNSQDVNLCHKLLTKVFYGVPMSSARREHTGERGILEGLEHLSVAGIFKVGQRAPILERPEKSAHHGNVPIIRKSDNPKPIKIEFYPPPDHDFILQTLILPPRQYYD